MKPRLGACRPMGTGGLVGRRLLCAPGAIAALAPVWVQIGPSSPTGATGEAAANRALPDSADRFLPSRAGRNRSPGELLLLAVSAGIRLSLWIAHHLQAPDAGLVAFNGQVSIPKRPMALLILSLVLWAWPAAAAGLATSRGCGSGTPRRAALRSQR